MLRGRGSFPGTAARKRGGCQFPHRQRFSWLAFGRDLSRLSIFQGSRAVISWFWGRCERFRGDHLSKRGLEDRRTFGHEIMGWEYEPVSDAALPRPIEVGSPTSQMESKSMRYVPQWRNEGFALDGRQWVSGIVSRKWARIRGRVHALALRPPRRVGGGRTETVPPPSSFTPRGVGGKL